MNQQSRQEYADKVFSACGKAIEDGQLNEQPPDVIFHLTKADVLSKIFSTRRLWASLATTMNDSLEVQHAVNVAVGVVEKRREDGDTEYLTALHEFLLDPSSAPKGARYNFDHFVVAFCGRPEKSGQWLNYGHSGNGVAIGFHKSIAKTFGYDLVRVDYEPKSQEKRIGLLVDAGASTFEVAAPDDGDRPTSARLTAHIVALQLRMVLAARLKHPSFSDEDEWRLLGHDITHEGRPVENPKTRSRPIEFRTVGGQIIPYEKLDFSEKCADLVREVIVGHASPLSEDAVRLLARENGLNIVVSRSDVPVRPKAKAEEPDD